MGLPIGTVTLLFTDIEGSTRLLQQLGDAYGAVLEEHHQIIREVVREHEGAEVDTQGDAFFLAFARATEGFSAAVAIQRAFAAHAWPGTESVRVRMGLLTGQPKLAGDRYVGLDVHRAARITAAAHGGQILLSSSTAELVQANHPAGISFTDLGRHRLKDLEQPEHIFEAAIDDLGTHFPPIRSLDSHPNNLPAELTVLVGRERELEALLSLVRTNEVRLVTLTGAGGMGKTRLALAAGGRLLEAFTAGVYFVALASVRDAGLVAPAIGRVLRVHQTEAIPVTESLRLFLQRRDLLLILDNFEQVTDAASIVIELLENCPRLKILVTSRVVLRLSGEHDFRVPPLQLPDMRRFPGVQELARNEAVDLFVSRALAAKADFEFNDENARPIAEICLRLEGIPLAIELAAARVRVLMPAALLRRLHGRLQLLTGGPRNSPERQQTLRGTIAWSYDLLTRDQQAVLRRMSVFSGGCSLEAAEIVCSQPSDVGLDFLEVVAALIDSSLLQGLPQGAEEPRFQMLETIREFAAEKLEECAEAGALRRVHLEYFVKLAQETAPLLKTSQILDALRLFKREEQNLLASLEWAKETDPDAAKAIQDALTTFRKQQTYLLGF